MTIFILYAASSGGHMAKKSFAYNSLRRWETCKKNKDKLKKEYSSTTAHSHTFKAFKQAFFSTSHNHMFSQLQSSVEE